METEPGQGLVGLYLHTFKANGEYQYQGWIEAFLGNGYYLVLHYTADGDPNYSQIASLQDMRAAGWRFYKTEAQWREAGNELNRKAAREGYTPPGSPPTLGLS